MDPRSFRSNDIQLAGFRQIANRRDALATRSERIFADYSDLASDSQSIIGQQIIFRIHQDVPRQKPGKPVRAFLAEYSGPVKHCKNEKKIDVIRSIRWIVFLEFITAQPYLDTQFFHYGYLKQKIHSLQKLRLLRSLKGSSRPTRIPCPTWRHRSGTI